MVCCRRDTRCATAVHAEWFGGYKAVAHVQAVAEAQFAQYLEKQGAQLVGEDVEGQTYDFRFRFWLNNQSRMYLIEGCLEMIKKYKLQKGDVIVFARKGDGTLVVGGRPAGPVSSSAHSFLFPCICLEFAVRFVGIGSCYCWVTGTWPKFFAIQYTVLRYPKCTTHRLEVVRGAPRHYF